VMVHLSDGEAWNALDNFDPDFVMDVRNVHIGLAIDDFTPFTECHILLSLVGLCYFMQPIIGTLQKI
jgi:hypothetical protein